MRSLKTVALCGALLALLAAPAAANHAYNHPRPPDVVRGTRFVRPINPAPKPPTSVLGTRIGNPEVASEVDAGLLPFTGAELTGFTVAGLAAIGLGTVLVRSRRRTSS